MLLGAIGVNGAQTNLVRLAVIPFSAPPQNDALQKAARELPDILTVELSNENRFQLVERDKVNAIWSEMHLAEDGFVSADTAARLGHILSCDWLAGGSLVQVGRNTQIWIKVIDVHSGVVLDLNTFPYSATNLSAAVSAIPPFLAQVDPRSQPRQFIALGRFADQSLSSSRADWSQRLPSMIEKHFIAAGYGVVEREAIAPIFSEFQFESAGLTGDYTNRVKLKPAFWIVDGGYKWMFDTQEKLSIALRVQRVGSPVQIFRFEEPIGDVENAVVDSVQCALTNATATNPERAPATESTAEADTAMKYAAGHDEFAGGNVATVRNDALNKLKQAVLLDSKNMRAQYMLGMALFESLDPEEVRQGKQILEDVTASKDSKYAAMAKNLLDDFATGRLTIKPLAMGLHEIVPHGQPLSWPTITNLPPAVDHQIDTMNQFTNIAARAEPVLQIPPPKSSGYFECITAVKLSHGEVFIACKPKPMHSGPIQLFKYDPATASTVEIPLPPMINRPINALEADENHLWLGTDGNGLVEIFLSGQLVHAYSESDGFPTPSISSLRLEGGHLQIGFGERDSGSIDMETGKFTGRMSEANIFKPGSDMLVDFNEPPATGTNSGFMAVLVPQKCVSICKPRGTNWTRVNLSTNFALNDAYCLSLDQSAPNLLWIGNDNGHLTLLDMNNSQVIAECSIGDSSWIQWIVDDGDQMVLIVSGYYSNTYYLYCLNKSLLAGHFTPSS